MQIAQLCTAVPTEYERPGAAHNVRYDLPRAFRTADLRLIHPAICCSRYSSWTCRGVRYWSPECLRFELYQNSMYLTISRYACSRFGYWVRKTRSFFKEAMIDSDIAYS